MVIGSGAVGAFLTAELGRRGFAGPVVLYGAEPVVPYDRVRLSSYLAGEVDRADMDLPDHGPVALTTRYNCPVTAIDPAAHTLTDATGKTQRYGQLVLATGSRPFVPQIEGLDQTGVFTFRDLSDAERLLARRARTRQTIVLGGGLLGLETARAMRRFNTDVTVVEHNEWLMLQQLDADAGEALLAQVARQGIACILGDSVVAALGDGRITGVRLRSGRELPCDTLIIAAGIRPNIDLARQAALAVGRGIKIDEGLRTSDPAIYAIGECAEYDGRVYGLVGPGFDQAAVLADRLTGGASHYAGSVAATRLKVMEAAVFSVGRTGVDEEPGRLHAARYRDPDSGALRKVLIDRDRLVGAMAVGEWPELGRVQDAVVQHRRVWPWQLARFRHSGFLWPAEEAEGIAHWPASARVCNCMNVTLGELNHALARGCADTACLAAQTRASTVCGSCRPLLAELVGAAKLEPARGARTLVATGLISLLAVLAFLLLPAIPYADSVQVPLRWDALWREGLLKQISGFTLLGLSILVAALSLRKRARWVVLGSFDVWRVVHVLVALLAVAALVAHTGLRLGDNLNLVLVACFLALIAVGAVAGGVIGLEHALPRRLARRVRSTSVLLQVLLLWPVPVLLGFHIAKTYWY